MRIQSLFKSVGCPVSLRHRRSLFSVIFPVHSARVGSNLSFERRWLSLSPRLSANPQRTCSSLAPMSSSVSHPEYRLPLNVKPAHYDLTIRTNLENQTFDGFVDVQCVTGPILSAIKYYLHLPQPRCPSGHLRTHLQFFRSHSNSSFRLLRCPRIVRRRGSFNNLQREAWPCHS